MPRERCEDSYDFGCYVEVVVSLGTLHFFYIQDIPFQELTNGSVVFERGCCGINECYKGQGTGSELMHDMRKRILRNNLGHCIKVPPLPH